MARQYRLTAMRRMVNAVVAEAVKAGIAPKRTQLLSVKGRKSGVWYTTPVNLVVHGGIRYLVAPYGERSWVKNMAAARSVRLRHGRTEEDYSFDAAVGDEAAAVLHQYWRENAITRPFFSVTGKPDAAAFLTEVATHPVFRLRSVAQS